MRVSGSDRTRCLVPVDPHGDECPLFLTHGADGGVDFVRAIARRLPANRPVLGIQMEGYASRPPPARSIEALAGLYVRELLEVRPMGPYILGGYSIGGVLAFEMVRQLESVGHSVSLVVLIDAKYPPGEDYPGKGGMPEVNAKRPPRPWLERVWRRRVSSPVKQVIVSACVLFGWRLPRFWRIRTRYFWRMLVVSRDAYRPRAIHAPMLLIASDGTTPIHEATWAPLSKQGCRTVEIAAEHLELVREPYLSELAFHVQKALVDHAPDDGPPPERSAPVTDARPGL